MESNYYKLYTTIDSYYATETDTLSQDGYEVKFSRKNIGDFNWEIFEAFFLNNGITEDFKLNGWTFSYVIQGHYRIYNMMHPDSPHFTINGIDPKTHSFKAEIYTRGFLKEAAADFMNNIILFSLFPDKDIAMAFNKLQNCDQKGPCTTTKLLPLIQEVYHFYKKHYTPCPNERLWEQIRITYNKALDICKRDLDSFSLKV